MPLYSAAVSFELARNSSTDSQNSFSKWRICSFVIIGFSVYFLEGLNLVDFPSIRIIFCTKCMPNYLLLFQLIPFVIFPHIIYGINSFFKILDFMQH